MEEVAPKGIDLEKLHKDVERIVRSLLRRRWSWALKDADDLIQEVFLQILELNGTPKEHDPEKGSFGGYVWKRLSDSVQKMSAVVRGGSGRKRQVENIPLDEAAIPAPDEFGQVERSIYLEELRSRPGCPQDVSEYLKSMHDATSSDDLREALQVETQMLTARRRRLFAWLRAEGEIDGPDLDPDAEYSHYQTKDKFCICGIQLKAYQGKFCSLACSGKHSNRPKKEPKRGVCPECLQEFDMKFKPRPGKKKFCSSSCSAKFGNKRRKPPVASTAWKVDPNNESDDAD